MRTLLPNLFLLVVIFSDYALSANPWDYSTNFPQLGATTVSYVLWYPGDVRFKKEEANDDYYVMNGIHYSVNTLKAWGEVLGETAFSSHNFSPRVWTATWEWGMANEDPPLTSMWQYISGGVESKGLAQYDYYTLLNGQGKTDSRQGVGAQIIGAKREGNDNIAINTNAAGAAVDVKTNGSGFLSSKVGNASVSLSWPPSLNIPLPLPALSYCPNEYDEMTQFNPGAVASTGGYLDAYIVTWYHTGLGATVKAFGSGADSFNPTISYGECRGVSYFEVEPGP